MKTENQDIKNLFFMEILSKIKILKEHGLNFCLSGFRDEGAFVYVDIFGADFFEKRFNFSFDGEILSLSNEEYKQVNKSLHFEAMVTYLFILLNGGPIVGVLEFSQDKQSISCLEESGHVLIA